MYLFLVLVRLYFALSPSYIHPDEHFQGPEVIAGEVFGWPIHRTWEFSSTRPIRSVFPLWLIYGIPLTLLKWVWEGLGYGAVPPRAVFYALRALMFMLSFVLEDWALHELLPQPKERRVATTLVASSYVTWTYQTHTFSNSIETLVVLWSLVLIGRIRDDREHTQITACVALAFLGVFGVFNRITFPAFLVVPAVQLAPHLLEKPMRLLVIAVSGVLVIGYAVMIDTEFYDLEVPGHLRQLGGYSVLTPWNNLMYNLDSSNLAAHGLHPFWQHFALNLPHLLGPAALLLPLSSRKSSLFWSAIVGIAILSIFRHQEPRFLLPAVPLLLASIRLPLSIHLKSVWVISWILFNIILGLLFGTYHQAGVVPVQSWLSQQLDITRVTWWKTYSPPHWMLDGRNGNVTTVDLMGMEGVEMIDEIFQTASCAGDEKNRSLFVAPASAVFLDAYTMWQLQEVWRWNRHVGLDDLDFANQGVWPTVKRVVERRGLVVWEVRRICSN